MALSKTQEAFITKLRAVGNSELGVALDAPIWTYDDDFDRIEGVRRVNATQIEGD